YSFRLMFMTFHGEERFRNPPVPTPVHEDPNHEQHGHGSQALDAHDDHGHDDHAAHPVEPRESPWVVTVPLILLAIPSVVIGWMTIEPTLVGDWFGNAIVVSQAHPAAAEFREEWHGVVPFMLHGFTSLPFWLALAGIASAWYLYLIRPELP